jgi:CubicO group peptidase (beta-lactamase class C family)
MESLDSLFTSAVSSGQIPGAVLAASSPDGRFNYLKAFGRTFCEADSPALATDATFWLASATKLFTAVAALQCVDKGLVSLDEDISRVLPELKTPVVLKGWDEDEQPILEEAKTEISLRFVYYIFLPTMATSSSIDAQPPMRC